MTAVWLFARSELRGHWRSWLALAVVAGLSGALVTAVASGARRTGRSAARARPAEVLRAE